MTEEKKMDKITSISGNKVYCVNNTLNLSGPYNYTSIQNQKDDLLPQASSIARFLLIDILNKGKVSYPVWLKRVRDCYVTMESVLLRLPELEITTNERYHHDYSDIYIELKRDVVINPASENLIRVPSWMHDAILNARDRSKSLYLVFSSQIAKYEGVFLPDLNLYTWFLNLARDFTQPTEIRLVSLSQAVIFSEGDKIENLRHDAMAILREYHRSVIQIDDYFQSFTRKPTLIRGIGNK